MDGALKKSVVVVLVLFIGWLLFTDPTGLADLLGQLGSMVWEALTKLFEALGSFISAATS